jgi:hypothetical protein
MKRRQNKSGPGKTPGQKTPASRLTYLACLGYYTLRSYVLLRLTIEKKVPPCRRTPICCEAPWSRLSWK